MVIPEIKGEKIPVRPSTIKWLTASVEIGYNGFKVN